MPIRLTKNKFMVFGLSFILVATSLLMAGCGSKYGPKTVKVNYYPKCYQPIDDLRAAEEKLKKDMLTGAVAGAAVGLGVGIASTGTVRGALVGAGVGLVAGLLGSYLISSSMQQKALQERFAAYNTSIDAETTNLNIAVKYAKTSCDCYDAEYKQLKKQFNKKGSVMSQEEMLVRLKEIRDGNNDAIKVLEVFKADAVKHTETYAQIYKNEETRTADKAPKAKMSQLKTKQNKYARASKSTEDTIALIARRNSIVENDINQREIARNGQNMLAVKDNSSSDSSVLLR
jgi:hypothetical protein